MTVIHEIRVQKSDADDIMLIGELYFSNNDKVKKHEELIEIETSKSVSNIDSPGEGFVEYFVKTGENVEVGKLIICIHDEPLEELASELFNDSGVGDNDCKGKILSK
jgi:pyruvate/2-oxoglutarate dehydrogenase complex dihydrolipoamide acyltransferase (E2) component